MRLQLVALAYALVASGMGWALLLTVGKGILPEEDRTRYLVAWFVLTVGMFLSPNGSVFLIGAFVFLLVLRRGNADPLACCAFLLAAAPPAGVAIQNLPGGINYLIDFTFPLILSMILLTPIALSKLAQRLPGAGATDACVFGFLLLVFLLGFRETSFTSGLRSGTVWFFGALVPYLAFSRGIVSTEQLTRVVSSLVACLVIVAVIAFVASIIRWQIYDVVVKKVFGTFQFGYIVRAGMLRTGGTMGGSPISLGVMMVVALMLLNGFARNVRGRWQLAALVGACLLGLLASVSRGPMIGAVFALFTYQLSKPNPVASGMKVGVLGLVGIIPLVLFTSTGRDLLAMIPFVGTEDSGSVTYRQDLAAAGWTVIQRNPLFGSPSFLDTPEMEAMRQGQGIIDLVNTYLAYALQYGIVPTVLFVVAILSSAYLALREARRLDVEADAGLRAIGGGLFAALIGYAFTIATTSLTGVLSPLGWILIGLNVAFVRSARVAAASSSSREVVRNVTELEHEDAPALPIAASSPHEGVSSLPQRARSSIGLQTPFDFDPTRRWNLDDV